MRKFLISILLASAAATPALAGPNGPRWGAANPDQTETQSDSRAERRQARAERSGGSQAQSNSGQTEVRPFAGGRGQAQSDNGQAEVRSFGGRGRASFGGGPAADSSDNVSGFRGGEVGQGSNAVTRSTIRQQQADEGRPTRPTNWQTHERRIGDASIGIRRHGSTDDGAEQQAPSSGGRSIQWRRLPKTGSGDLVQPDRPLPRVLRTRVPVISHTPREGTQPPPRTDFARRTASAVHWNTDWRHNHRYDWWSWRRTHRSFFHLGFYYDPFGWGYQPYSIGWRLWPAYYSSRYWISDPWYYRLPYAPPGYRWIRYYDDLLLVDMWDGQVIDVIYDFFW